MLLAAVGWVLAGVLTAPPASAHGISGDAGTTGVGGFVGLGIEHMVLGWDHILFVAGILLLASGVRPAAKTITAFVLGHSLTLITATLAGWQIDPTAVDVVIVLSVAVVGGFGMLGGPRRWDAFTGIVFGFGLVHGLGLATRFQALGVPEDGLVWKLLAFNLGIEIGQLTAIMALVAFAGLVASIAARLRPQVARERRDTILAKTAFVGLFNLAAIAAPVLAYQGFTAIDGDVSDVALPAGSGCRVEDRTESFPAAGGGHPERTFYEPEDALPTTSFGHSLGDGYVVVLYPDTLGSDDLGRLRDYVSDTTGVLAGARPQPTDEVTAITATQQLTCPAIHLGALRQFSRTWLDSIGAPT